MKPSSRTLLGIALAIPLAAVLLVTFACLPAPVGDPEKSKVDPQFTGAWRAVNKDDPKDLAYVLLRPWDDHTYFMEYITVNTANGKDERELIHFKAWLTTIAGSTFITCQPLDDLNNIAPDPDRKPFWAVLRLDKTAGGMDARLIQPDSDLMKGLDTKDKIEAVITAHAGDKALYGDNDPISFKKLGNDDKAEVQAVLDKFSINKSGGIK